MEPLTIMLSFPARMLQLLSCACSITENCHLFKGIEDAKRLRQSVSECFERAALPATPPEVRSGPVRMLILASD
jgi:hypothetical protein